MTPDHLADLARTTVAGCRHTKAWAGGENAADEEGACAPCIEKALEAAVRAALTVGWAGERSKPTTGRTDAPPA